MNHNDAEPLTLSKKQLARELRLSVRSIERLRAVGSLPPTVPGLRTPRWYRETVIEWLRATPTAVKPV